MVRIHHELVTVLWSVFKMSLSVTDGKTKNMMKLSQDTDHK